MRRRPIARSAVLVTALVVSLAQGPGPSSAAPAPRVAAAAAAQPVAQAVAQAEANAAANGVSTAISVVDRATGAVLAETGNAGSQVASESIVKLMIAAYHLVANGGWASTPAALQDRLSYMLRVSDDSTATNLFRGDIVPSVAARYGMGSTTNATDRVGHWGAVRITAHDMTTFLWRASQDPAVGPWLLPVMAQSAPRGSDGFDQAFGLNALSGDHGSKQGWGGDSFFTRFPYAVHSVGYTDRYFVAILQTAPTYPDPMRATATTAAQLIQASTAVPPVRDGDFVVNGDDGTLYRVAGGAPVYVSEFAAVPGSAAYRVLSGTEFAALAQVPRDGTLLEAGGQVFIVAGGAPLYVSDYGRVGGYRPGTVVDPAAVRRAGEGGRWSHLTAVPADGTLLQNGSEIFVVAGGAPLYVSDYAPIGGYRPAVPVDPAALNAAGQPAPWDHLRFYPSDGTLLQAGPDGSPVYLVAGGAPTYVTSYDAIGGPRPATRVDPAALANGGQGGRWAHLRFTPPDGTLLQAGPDGSAVYLVAGGAPTYLSSYDAIGGPRPAARVDPVQIAYAGTGGWFGHLSFRPADGTLVQAGGDIHVVAGGAPVYLSDYAAIGGYRPASVIDPAAVRTAGGPAEWSHLTDVPSDGTLLQAGSDVFVAAGGAPVYLADFADIGGYRPPVRIDPAAVAAAGTDDRYRHVRQVPADGTALLGSPGGRRYVVTDGTPRPAEAGPGVTVSQAAVDRAGEPGVWSHLRATA
ncbi:hypothetical protein [Nakamurella deserti]|uniref:hypothetical protein n=1 Tax=Nakamurella deserti TaxID=2164074 RepID=UPI000DBE0AE2|nr:hypothetical protein [Nakamurella deserti]